MPDMKTMGATISEAMELYYTMKNQLKEVEKDLLSMQSDLRKFQERQYLIESRIAILEENRKTVDEKIARIDDLSKERMDRVKTETAQELRTRAAEVISEIKTDAAVAKASLVIDISNKLNQLENQLKAIQSKES